MHEKMTTRLYLRCGKGHRWIHQESSDGRQTETSDREILDDHDWDSLYFRM